MITAVEFKGKYNLGVNSSEKFFYSKEENKSEHIKNIPIVIYNFEKEELDLQFISEQMKKFKYSCHVAFLNQMEIGDDIYELSMKLREMGVAVFVFYDIVRRADGSIGVIGDKLNVPMDRLVLKDKTDDMQITELNTLKREVSKISGQAINDIGVCSSPFSFGENACLCAVWARRIMAKYTSNTEVALPSANHECMEECGCIRKIYITEDVEAPAVTVKESTKKDTGKEPKQKIVKGVSNIRGMF